MTKNPPTMPGMDLLLAEIALVDAQLPPEPEGEHCPGAEEAIATWRKLKTQQDKLAGKIKLAKADIEAVALTELNRRFVSGGTEPVVRFDGAKCSFTATFSLRVSIGGKEHTLTEDYVRSVLGHDYGRYITTKSTVSGSLSEEAVRNTIGAEATDKLKSAGLKFTSKLAPATDANKKRIESARELGQTEEGLKKRALLSLLFSQNKRVGK